VTSQPRQFDEPQSMAAPPTHHYILETDADRVRNRIFFTAMWVAAIVVATCCGLYIWVAVTIAPPHADEPDAVTARDASADIVSYQPGLAQIGPVIAASSRGNSPHAVASPPVVKSPAKTAFLHPWTVRHGGRYPYSVVTCLLSGLRGDRDSKRRGGVAVTVTVPRPQAADATVPEPATASAAVSALKPIGPREIHDGGHCVNTGVS
jgi:hypothetical protein